MNPQLQRLIELQITDNEIAELKQSKATIPQQIESGKASLKEKQNQLKKAEDAFMELQTERKDLEMDVATENDHIVKTKTKLPSVKTNKEYSAILAEVNADYRSGKILAGEMKQLCIDRASDWLSNHKELLEQTAHLVNDFLADDAK